MWPSTTPYRYVWALRRMHMYAFWLVYTTWAVLNTDLPRKAYMALYNSDTNGKRDWVLNVKM